MQGKQQKTRMVALPHQTSLMIKADNPLESISILSRQDQVQQIILENKLAQTMEFRSVDTATRILKAAGLYG